MVDFRIHYLRAFVVNRREAVILRHFVFEHNKVNVMSEIQDAFKFVFALDG